MYKTQFKKSVYEMNEKEFKESVHDALYSILKTDLVSDTIEGYNRNDYCERILPDKLIKDFRMKKILPIFENNGNCVRSDLENLLLEYINEQRINMGDEIVKYHNELSVYDMYEKEFKESVHDALYSILKTDLVSDTIEGYNRNDYCERILPDKLIKDFRMKKILPIFENNGNCVRSDLENLLLEYINEQRINMGDEIVKYHNELSVHNMTAEEFKESVYDSLYLILVEGSFVNSEIKLHNRNNYCERILPDELIKDFYMNKIFPIYKRNDNCPRSDLKNLLSQYICENNININAKLKEYLDENTIGTYNRKPFYKRKEIPEEDVNTELSRPIHSHMGIDIGMRYNNTLFGNWN